MVLFTIGCKFEVRINRLQQIEVGSARRPRIGRDRCADFLDIVGDSLFRIAVFLIKVESRIKARHAIQRLQCIAVLAAFRALPCTTTVGGAEWSFLELAGNFLIVLGGNGCDSRITAVPPVIISRLERQRIGVALEVHIQHGGAICRHGDGIRLLEGKVAAIRHAAGQGCRGRGLRLFLARLCRVVGSSRQNGIIFIIRVLAPVHDGVVHVSRRPLRLQHNAGSGRIDVGHGAAVKLPAVEGIAQLGGRANGGQIDRVTLRNIFAVHLRAAVGVEGHPVSGHGHRSHIGIRRHDRFSREGIRRALDDPAGHNVIFDLQVGRQLDCIVRAGSFPGCMHVGAVIRAGHEVHVVHIAVLRRHLDGGVLRVTGHNAEGKRRIADIPSHEALAFHSIRRFRFSNAFAVRLVHDLGIHNGIPILEHKRDVHVSRIGRNRIDARGRNAAEGLHSFTDVDDVSKRRHRQAAENHEE